MKFIILGIAVILAFAALPAAADQMVDGATQLRELRLLACPPALAGEPVAESAEESGRLLHDDPPAKNFLTGIRLGGLPDENWSDEHDLRLFPGEEAEDQPLLQIPTRSDRVNLQIDSELAAAPRLTFSISYCW